MGRWQQIAAVAWVTACVGGCASPDTMGTDEERPARESVVLIHGLARTSHSMSRMQRALTASGYTVYSMRYASTKKTVEQIVEEDVVPLLVQIQAPKPARIHFVAHSLGNIVIRQYFATHALANAGRIVMLGPPSQGSEVVDTLGRFALYDWINGPAGQQLGTSTNSLPSRLPIPPVNVGVIAGTRSINWFLSAMIPGPDDGKVSIERAKLPGMEDFITVDTAHPFLMQNKEAINLTLAFLRDGSFDRCRSTPSGAHAQLSDQRPPVGE